MVIDDAATIPASAEELAAAAAIVVDPSSPVDDHDQDSQETLVLGEHGMAEIGVQADLDQPSSSSYRPDGPRRLLFRALSSDDIPSDRADYIAEAQREVWEDTSTASDSEGYRPGRGCHGCGFNESELEERLRRSANHVGRNHRYFGPCRGCNAGRPPQMVNGEIVFQESSDSNGSILNEDAEDSESSSHEQDYTTHW
eukprot:TRINITY_DN117046_c0_g1_i1.p1 TRINITY_DN117046_c0_g1~~TRINITY_DN117046_c0_g1_i1.p1  ORF type:complete len:198 (-),score=44.03 TRINITY_DN117046_c0_g1_i1:166-759(-)